MTIGKYHFLLFPHQTEVSHQSLIITVLGVYLSEHESLRCVWSSGHRGRPIFKAAFGINMFEQIVFMRFDDRDTRQVRRDSDHSGKPSLKIAGKTTMLVRM